MSSHSRALVLLLSASLMAAAPPTHQKPQIGRTDRDGNPLPAGALTRMGIPRLHQLRNVRAAAFSPDGKIIATSSDNHPVTLWDVVSGKRIRPCEDGFHGFRSGDELIFARDGKLLIGKSRDVRVWNVSTGKLILASNGLPRIAAIALSPDGKILATGGGPIRLWNLSTGKEMPRFVSTAAHVDQLVFSPDGKTLASLARDRPKSRDRAKAISGYVALWDVKPGKQVAEQDKIRPGTLVGDGNRYTLQGKDGRIEVRDLTKKRPFRKLSVKDLRHVVSAGGDLLASINQQQTVRVWDTTTGRLIQSVRGERSPEAETRAGYGVTYFPFAFSPDGKVLATGSCIEGALIGAGGVRLWNVATGKELLPAENHFAAVTCLAFAANGKVVASGSADQTVRVWDATTGRFLRCFSGCKGTIDALALSATGRVLASSSQDRTVRLWDVNTGRQMHCWKRPGSHVSSLSFLSGGKTLQICDVEGLVCRYTVASGKLTGQNREHKDGFDSLLLGPDGLGLIASTAEMGEEERKKLLPRPFARSRSPKATPMDSLENLRQVRGSADGRLTATVENTSPGGRRGPRYRIRVWEVATGGLVAELPAVGAPVCSLVFSAGNGGLFIGHGKGKEGRTAVVAWDLVACRSVGVFDGPVSSIRALALAPDGGRLVSGSEEADVLIWDVSTLFPVKKQPPLTDDELGRHWTRLGGASAEEAYHSVYRLAASPLQTVGFLNKELRAFPAAGEPRLRKLIGDLDDETFAVRDKAAKELERMAGLAEPALRRTLKARPSLEVHRRIEQLLGKLPPAADVSLQVLRGVSVLERIGTRKARAVLKDLARLDPDGLRGREAEAALHRLAARPIQP